MNEEKEPTPANELRERIMDPRIPKSEAEHWARYEIERLHEIIIGLKLEWQFLHDMDKFFSVHAPMEYQAYLNQRMTK